MSPPPAIVAATDFSAQARHATERAARIAQEHAGTLTLLHVLPGPLMAQVRRWLGADSLPPAKLLEDARQRLQTCAERLPKAQLSTLVSEGSALDETLAAAERQNAALIVVGARGESFMRRAVLGGTAERLVRSAARPVLVVRQTPREPYRRVLVALDLSAGSDAALRIARWVAPQARLVLTTVFQVPLEGRLRLAGVDQATIARYREHARSEARRGLLALASRAGLPDGSWEACVAEGDASYALVELEQEQDCDLLVVGKHSRSAAADMLLGSVTQHLLAEGTADVLVSTPNDG